MQPFISVLKKKRNSLEGCETHETFQRSYYSEHLYFSHVKKKKKKKLIYFIMAHVQHLQSTLAWF